MKVLMISTDRKIFEPNSEVRGRMIDYAGLFDELRIIVFAKKSQNFNNFSLTSNCQVYNTNSRSPIFYIWDAIKIGKEIAKKEENWTITCQDPFETGLVGWFLKKGKRKLNLQIHTDFMNSHFEAESLKNKIRVKMAKWLLPKTDSVRVVSERIKKSLVVLKLKSEPIVLPIFVESKIDSEGGLDLHQKYPQFEFIVLMASRLTKEKNFPLALKSFAKAKQEITKKSGLVIVGSGQEKEKIKQIIKELKLMNEVVIEPWVENLSAYYQIADLFLLTSNYEGYGRTLIESAEAGCPVLTTNIGLVGEIITKENGLTCSVGDHECLTEKIIWATNNIEELKILANQLKNDLATKILLDKTEYLKKYKESLSVY